MTPVEQMQIKKVIAYLEDLQRLEKDTYEDILNRPIATLRNILAINSESIEDPEMGA